MLTGTQPYFHPKFTHQIFHKDETIKGMKDLSVTVFLSPTTLRPYVYWCCSDYGQQYDDVTNIMRISFAKDEHNTLLTNRQEFINVLEEETKEKFKMHGKLIYSFTKNVPHTFKEPSDFSLLNK